MLVNYAVTIPPENILTMHWDSYYLELCGNRVQPGLTDQTEAAWCRLKITYDLKMNIPIQRDFDADPE